MRHTRMQTLWLIVLLALTALAWPRGAPAVVYGNDDRTDYYQVSDPVLLLAADSVVALFTDSQLSPVAGGWMIDVWSYGTLGEYQELCPTERFVTQPVPGFCSGMLIDSTTIVTAGHCISDASCPSTRFVFGFAMEAEGVPRSEVADDDVYQCAEVVADVETGIDDFAIVRTDRPVVAHLPIPIRRTGAVESDPDVAGLFNIGHPIGLPMKLTGGPTPIGSTGLGGASVMDTFPEYFEANVDSFGGNSGSGIVSLDSAGEIRFMEGILVRGNPDRTWTGSCYEENVCDDSVGCPGWEEATRITNLAPFLPAAVPLIPGAWGGVALIVLILVAGVGRARS